MFVIEPVTDVPFDIGPAFWKAAAKAVSETAPEAQKGIVNVLFVDDDAMRAYNRDYRKIDSTTDVLSFHYFEDFSECGQTDVAGEVLFSESKIRAQCAEYGNTEAEETAKLVVHSLLHLLGYDHEDDEEYAAMLPLEEAAAKRMGEYCGITVR